MLIRNVPDLLEEHDSETIKGTEEVLFLGLERVVFSFYIILPK